MSSLSIKYKRKCFHVCVAIHWEPINVNQRNCSLNGGVSRPRKLGTANCILNQVFQVAQVHSPILQAAHLLLTLQGLSLGIEQAGVPMSRWALLSSPKHNVLFPSAVSQWIALKSHKLASKRRTNAMHNLPSPCRYLDPFKQTIDILREAVNSTCQNIV